MYGTMLAYSNYQLKQVEEVLKLEQFKTTQFLESQRKVLGLQQSKKDEIRKQQQAVINKRTARQRKVDGAWARYYKEPYNCQHPSSQNEQAWCRNYKAAEKRKFLDLIAQGKIIVG